MLKQLQNEMMEARTTVEQLCSEWNWTLSDKEATTNEIVINKGKVTAIEITKEDTATIEMLRETIRNMNETINNMNNEIANLKGELLEKDLLLDEFREAMDEKVSKIHALEDKMEGMKFGYENQIAKLKEENNKPRIEVVDDPLYNEPKEKPVVKQTKAKEVYDLAYEELESHDGVKVKVRDLKNNITFYAVKNLKYDKPAYSVSGNKFTRHPNVVKHLYKYDEQLTEHLMNRLSKKFNLQQTVEEDINDEQEIVVNVTNDNQVEIHVDEDPMAGADELDL